MLCHMKISPIFGRHLVVMLLIVHLLLGFRHFVKSTIIGMTLWFFV